MNFEAAAVELKVMALFKFVAKGSRQPADISREDFDTVRQAGWSNEEITQGVQYASITAPMPTWSPLFCETSMRVTLARPVINGCSACVSSGGGMIENPIFVPTLSFWPTPKENHASKYPASFPRLAQTPCGQPQV